MALGLAFRVFFAALFDRDAAERLRAALEPKAAAPVETKPPEIKPIQPVKPKGRSEALTLLASLQRDARLLDIVQEPLATYSDAQIGAASREVLRGCATVLERFFGLQPLMNQAEGSSIEVPTGYDPHRYRVLGNVSGEPPFRGALVHQGWVASKCELPEWNGSADSALVIAPAEVEVGARS